MTTNPETTGTGGNPVSPPTSATGSPAHTAPETGADATQEDAESPFVTFSRMLDRARAEGASDGEHQWQRVTKVCEESGEVWQAMAGYAGHSPRKGRTRTLDDVRAELLDTASAALCAWAHLTGNEADPVPVLLTHTATVARRFARATEGNRGSSQGEASDV